MRVRVRVREGVRVRVRVRMGSLGWIAMALLRALVQSSYLDARHAVSAAALARAIA